MKRGGGIKFNMKPVLIILLIIILLVLFIKYNKMENFGDNDTDKNKKTNCINDFVNKINNNSNNGTKTVYSKGIYSCDNYLSANNIQPNYLTYTSDHRASIFSPPNKLSLVQISDLNNAKNNWISTLP